MREVEVHDEVRDWFVSLSEELQDRAAGKIDLLVEQDEQVRMPHSRALGRGLFELRFRLGEEAGE